MAKLQFSTKRLAIDKANTQIVAVVSGAVFVLVFSLVASKALLSQQAYQASVISKKEKAVKQLSTNVKAVDSLMASYQAFVATPTNVIGGASSGSGDKDGDNGKIILDALPSQYDFPAVTSSLEKILTEHNLEIQSIAGTDDEVAQAANEASDTPQPIDMPFSLHVDGNYNSMKDLISVLEHSVRPMHLQTLSISGGENKMDLTLSAKTFYQPAKQLKIETTVVK